MIQDQSESNSERGKDKNIYLSEEAGLTPLLAMTQSFEDCDWLVVQKGNKRALLRFGFIISLHFEIKGVMFPVLSYSLSLSHIIYVYIYIYIYRVPTLSWRPDSRTFKDFFKHHLFYIKHLSNSHASICHESPYSTKHFSYT